MTASLSAPDEPYEDAPDTGVVPFRERVEGLERFLPPPADVAAARAARGVKAIEAELDSPRAGGAPLDRNAVAPAKMSPTNKPARLLAGRGASAGSGTGKPPAMKRVSGSMPGRPAPRNAELAPSPPASPGSSSLDPGSPPPLPPAALTRADARIVVPPMPPLPPIPPVAPPDEAVADDSGATTADGSSADSTPAISRAEQTEQAALTVRGLTKRFGDAIAVDGIDLTVPTGSFYGIVGPNGAGKTTTLSMIAGLLRPDRGTIHVGGVDAASAPRAAKRLMGVLPDRLRTFDRLTGRQLLYYYGVLRGLPGAVVESRTADLARAFDLTDALGRVVSDYSAGMTKKVMIAGAMIHSPRVLVLDEPFEAVDPVSSAIILDILGTYVAHGGTVVLSSHGMDLVERVCTRLAVIVAGQVLAEGTVDEVRGELTLEQRFVELAGGLSDVEGLEWLHTFSD